MGVLSRLNDWFWSGTDKRIDKKVNAVKAEMDQWLYRIPNKRYTKNFALIYRLREYEIWHSENVLDLINFYTFYPQQPGEMNSATRQCWYEWVRNVTGLPKMHIPVASLINTTMTQLLFGNGEILIKINDNPSLQRRLNKILKDNKFSDLMIKASDMEGYSGTIVLVACINPSVSDTPIINMYPSSRIDYEEYNGKITKIITRDEYIKDNDTYFLFTEYNKGKITYSLFKGQQEVDIDSIDETKGLRTITIDNAPLLAVWKKNAGNSKEFSYTQLGASDYEGILDCFQMCDEIYSTWNSYIRRTRPLITIREEYLPMATDSKGGVHGAIKPKEYELDTIMLSGRDDTKDPVKRDTPEIKCEPYFNAIMQQLQFIFSKIGVSPSSFELNVSNNQIGANTSSQAIYARAMATHFVRNTRVNAWKIALEELVKILLIYDDVLNGVGKVEENHYAMKEKYNNLDIVVTFGELDAEDFITRLDTAIKGLAGGVMSVETATEYAMKYKYTDKERETNLKEVKESNLEKLQESINKNIDTMNKVDSM